MVILNNNVEGGIGKFHGTKQSTLYGRAIQVKHFVLESYSAWHRIAGLWGRCFSERTRAYSRGVTTVRCIFCGRISRCDASRDCGVGVSANEHEHTHAVSRLPVAYSAAVYHGGTTMAANLGRIYRMPPRLALHNTNFLFPRTIERERNTDMAVTCPLPLPPQSGADPAQIEKHNHRALPRPP